MSGASDVNWQWYRLGELSAVQLYAMLEARIAIFVVEQNCAYQDLDGLDLDAEHLIGWSGREVAGYLRVLAPGTRFEDPSIGRIITTPAVPRDRASVATSSRRESSGRACAIRGA